MDRVREVIRTRHYSRSTEKAYCGWIRRYIVFHGKRHPVEMDAEEIAAFLSDLALRGGVAARTQNQALHALLFLYGNVLGVELPRVRGIAPAKTTRRIPVVLARDEIVLVLEQMRGVTRLMATLLYGTGMRVSECCQLRVKDVDLAANTFLLREGKAL